MKYYFLVGTQAVSTYPNIEAISLIDGDGDVICYDTETDTPLALMIAFEGWMDFVTISAEQYEYLINKQN